jgi:hypothetical protein
MTSPRRSKIITIDADHFIKARKHQRLGKGKRIRSAPSVDGRRFPSSFKAYSRSSSVALTVAAWAIRVYIVTQCLRRT